MTSNPLSSYAQLGLITGSISTTILAVIDEHQASMVLLAALVGALTGLGAGALYGYLKRRRRLR
jgi:hypothetical protein